VPDYKSLLKQNKMGKKIIITFTFSFYCFCVNAQKPQKLKEIHKMMKQAREIDSLPCIVIIAKKDTTWGKDLDWKWNKKEKIGEYHIDGKVFRTDSVFFYQDKDGFHSLSTTKFKKGLIHWDRARIIKGKIDVFVDNWESRGSGSSFNPTTTNSSGATGPMDPSKPAGYSGGSYSPSSYFIRKTGTPNLVSYNLLKRYVSDNPVALARFNLEFKAGEEGKDYQISNWEKIKAVLEIYNQ